MLNITIINAIVKSFENAVKNNYPNNHEVMYPEVIFTDELITATLNLTNMPFKAVRIEITENSNGVIIDLFWTKDNDNWFTSFENESPVETIIRDAMIPWHMDIISQYVK
jgi:hypothetical protein